MQDMFTYTVSDINGHAPTTGTGTWITFYGGTGANISTSGSQAVFGGQPGPINAIASIGFTPAASMIYTLTTTLKFNGTTSYGCWFGTGFANSPYTGGNSSGNPAPWMAICPQSGTGSNPAMGNYIGSTWLGGANVPAAYYSAPMVTTIKWNTSTGVTQYYINGTLWGTGTTSVPSGQFYAYFQGYQSGNVVSVKNITLNAQNLGLVQMLDNFDYTAADLNNQTPSRTLAGAKWTTNNGTGCSIAATGTQANITAASGAAAYAHIPFIPSPNTFYTLRTTFKFNGYAGGTNCDVSVGFETDGQTCGPWWDLCPQSGTGNNPTAIGRLGGGWNGTMSIPASYFSAPITATLTWDTSTGEARFYLNNIYQPNMTGTTPILPGLYRAFIYSYQTGTLVSVKNVVLTSQPLPVTFVYFGPACVSNLNTGNSQYNVLFDSGSGSAAWASARSHVSAICTGDGLFAWSGTANPYQTDAQSTQFFQYLNNNGLKFITGPQMLCAATNGTCATGEGYGSMSTINTELNNIARFGGSVYSIIPDEPLYWGHEVKCQLSISACAQQVTDSMNAIKSYFPNVLTEDIEPFGSVPVADLKSWISAYRSLGGPPLVAFYDDPYYLDRLNDRLPYTQAITDAGLAYGPCFNGMSSAATSDAQWVQSCLEAIQIYNASALPVPTRIGFGTWAMYPQQVVPETSPNTMAYAVNYYFASPYAVEPPPAELFRLINNTTGMHFFSADITEVNSYLTSGSNWAYQSIGNISPGGIYKAPAGAPGLVPMYRYSKASPLTHAFSMSSSDSALISAGLSCEKIAGYVFPDSTAGGSPLWTLTRGGDYFYTTDPKSKSDAIASGWTDCGTLCWLMPLYQQN